MSKFCGCNGWQDMDVEEWEKVRRYKHCPFCGKETRSAPGEVALRVVLLPATGTVPAERFEYILQKANGGFITIRSFLENPDVKEALIDFMKENL